MFISQNASVCERMTETETERLRFRLPFTIHMLYLYVGKKKEITKKSDRNDRTYSARNTSGPDVYEDSSVIFLSLFQ